MKRLLLLSLLITFLLPVTVFAVHFQDLPPITTAGVGAVRISPRIIEGERVGGVSVSGEVPEVVGSEAFSAKIDEIIAKNIGDGTGTVDLSYKIVRSAEVLTIIFLTETVTPTGARSGRVSTLSVDIDSLNKVAVTDLLGGNGLRIATDIVNGFIGQNFRNMPRISTLDETAHFYVTNDAVHFVFDRYEIAPGSEGIQSVPVYFDNLKRYFLNEDDFHINEDNHGVRMLPLRRLAEQFDFDVTWVWDSDARTHEIRLSRADNEGNGNGYVSLRLNENAYRRMHDITPRTLESAPVIIGGITFVPISFFEAILDIHYNILADGTIELTTYRQ